MTIDNILKSAGLKENYVYKDSDFYFWYKSFYQTYTEPSYYTSKDKEMVEVYDIDLNIKSL